MKPSSRWVRSLLLWATLAPTAGADMLVLSDGRIVEGTFVAGSESFIQFRSESGIQSYPRHEISSIHLSPPSEPSGATNQAAVRPATPAPGPDVLAAGAVVVPADTRLYVRFNKTLSSASERAGEAFQGVLHRDLMVDDKVAAPKGTLVQGRVSEVRGGKKLGAQYLKVVLFSLTVNGQKVPLITAAFGVERSGEGPAKLVGAEWTAGETPDENGEFTEARSHVKIPDGVVLAVPLKEAVALFP